MSQHLCTSLDVSPSGAGPSAWAGAAAFPLVFWRSQGAFNQSHVASYSIRCQSNTEVQRNLYQIPSYIDILRPVDPSKSLQVSPKPPQRVRFLPSSFSGHLRLHGAPRRGGEGGPQRCRNPAAQRRVTWHDTTTLRGSDVRRIWYWWWNCGIWWFHDFHGGKKLQMWTEIFLKDFWFFSWLSGWRDTVTGWSLVDFPWFWYFGSFLSVRPW